jgi:hypothetical protein
MLLFALLLASQPAGGIDDARLAGQLKDIAATSGCDVGQIKNPWREGNSVVALVCGRRLSCDFRPGSIRCVPWNPPSPPESTADVAEPQVPEVPPTALMTCPPTPRAEGNKDRFPYGLTRGLTKEQLSHCIMSCKPADSGEEKCGLPNSDDSFTISTKYSALQPGLHLDRASLLFSGDGELSAVRIEGVFGTCAEADLVFQEVSKLTQKSWGKPKVETSKPKPPRDRCSTRDGLRSWTLNSYKQPGGWTATLSFVPGADAYEVWLNVQTVDGLEKQFRARGAEAKGQLEEMKRLEEKSAGLLE